MTRDNEIKQMEHSSAKAFLTIQSFHQQQQALFDEFVLLRQKYDDQKANLLTTLWVYCGRYHPDLKYIPTLEDERSFIENDDEVGDFIVGQTLGEGQFATVKTCWKKDDTKTEYALKMIKKERVTSFVSLKRVSNEIDILKRLKSTYIVSVLHVMQTHSMLYIVTEKGGADLFEFFDEHPHGVPEIWAQEIISNVMTAIVYCHNVGVCHRDLKPENILLQFDIKEEKCISLKLCDFGLSTRYQENVPLKDFCGSPGFFAPEMITKGSYFGDKADIWSIGCVLLELVVGHEKFCDMWMTAYDYEILQDKEKFKQIIEEKVGNLQELLKFSDQLNDFIVKLLRIRSSERPSAERISGHIWLEGFSEKINKGGADNEIDSPKESNSSTSPLKLSISIDDEDAELEALTRLEVDSKTRSKLESTENGKISNLHLPPIQPQTPSVSKARKILQPSNSSVSSPVVGESKDSGKSLKSPSSLGVLLEVSSQEMKTSTSLSQLEESKTLRLSSTSSENGKQMEESKSLRVPK
jgi:serine/threonine protein kinase